jgi:hypothetical protein
MRTPRGSGWILVRKAGLEPASLAALAPKASVFAISPLPQRCDRGPEVADHSTSVEAGWFCGNIGVLRWSARPRGCSTTARCAPTGLADCWECFPRIALRFILGYFPPLPPGEWQRPLRRPSRHRSMIGCAPPSGGLFNCGECFPRIALRSILGYFPPLPPGGGADVRGRAFSPSGAWMSRP